jgi:hypothetical protein
MALPRAISRLKPVPLTMSNLWDLLRATLWDRL